MDCIYESADVVTGDCLLDQPQSVLVLPDVLPGITYSLSRQCELAFGSGSKPCPYMQSCAKLWCTGKARGQLVCQTRHFPWADGTSCGDRHLCYQGVCMDKDNITRIKVDSPDSHRAESSGCVNVLSCYNMNLKISVTGWFSLHHAGSFSG